MGGRARAYSKCNCKLSHLGSNLKVKSGSDARRASDPGEKLISLGVGLHYNEEENFLNRIVISDLYPVNCEM